MRKESGTIVYSPSDLIRYLVSPFGLWVDRYDLENPGAIRPDQESEEEIVLPYRFESGHRQTSSSFIRLPRRNLAEAGHPTPVRHGPRVSFDMQ